MARSRNIKPGFFTNDALSDCDPLARLLFAGLWCIADRAGRLEDRPKRIKAELLPYDECDADALLGQLERAGFVVRYQVAGAGYIEILNFSKHQNPHIKESPSSIPAPDEHSTSTVLEQCINEESTEQARLIPDSLNLIPDTPIKTNVEQARRDAVSDVFEHWQKTMGHQRSLLDVKRKKVIAARLKEGYSPDMLCKAISGCAASPFHMGDNDKGARYDGLDLILRDAAKVDQFVAMFENPPKPKAPAADAKHERRARWLAELRGGNNDAIIATARLVG